MQHHVEVDQSIKVEQTHQDTVLAFSDGIHGTVHVPAEVKRACQRELRGRGVKPGMIALRIFSDFPKEAITFRQVGKKSPAHRLAWETHQGKRKPDRVVTLEELLQYC